MISTGTVYAPWLAVAAACRVCEFMAVKASDDPFRFDVISGEAVLAPEEDSVGFVVCCVRFVVEGDHDRSLGDVFQGVPCD